MSYPILPPGSTVSLTLSGIPAELYLRLLLEAGRAGRGLRAEVLHRLRDPIEAAVAPRPDDAEATGRDTPVSRRLPARS